MNIIRSVPVALAVAAVAFPSFVTAQTNQAFKPLIEVLETSETTYPLTRCAGFYLSVLEWSGEARLGETDTASLKSSVFLLTNLAASTLMEQHGASQQAASEQTLKAVRFSAGQYIVRYTENLENTGSAWDEDLVWTADYEVCNALVAGE